MDLLEVLIINDGSKDQTEVIAKDYEEKYPDTFRCITKQNGGYGSTINIALESAKGTFFKLLDGDDWYNTDSLNSLLNRLATCNSDMIITGYTEVFEGSDKVKAHKYTQYVSEKEYIFEDICSNLNISMHAVMYRTELLNKINITENCFYTDSEFLLSPIPFVKTLTFLHLDIYQYRLALTGQSVSLDGMRKHYKDAERVFYKLTTCVNHINDDETSKKLFMLEKLAVIADFQLRAYLCLKPCKEIKKKLIRFDMSIRSEHIQISKKMENLMTKILRTSNYKTYFIYSYYVIIRMQVINKIRKG